MITLECLMASDCCIIRIYSIFISLPSDITLEHRNGCHKISVNLLKFICELWHVFVKPLFFFSKYTT